MKEEVKEILDSIKYHVDEDDWFEIEGHFLKPLLDYITNLQEIAEEHKNCTRKHWQQKCAEHCANEMIYKSRNEEAIRYIEKCRDYHKTYHSEERIFPDEITSLLIILTGDNNDTTCK